jgi:hypothetical protein
MKTGIQIIAALVLAQSLGSAGAQPVPYGPPSEGAGPRCLRIYDITQTKALDPQTILFRMRDGRVWLNSLHGSCPGLKYDGFEYATTASDICANMQSIHVLETRQTCLLGEFSPYAPPRPR